jgi:serine/threonine protein kinase
LTQLELISALVKPTAEDFAAIESPHAQVMEACVSAHWTGMCGSWEEACPGASSDGLDLLRGLLQFDPGKRLTADAALAHPFVNQFSQARYLIDTWGGGVGLRRFEFLCCSADTCSEEAVTSWEHWTDGLHEWLLCGLPEGAKALDVRRELMSCVAQWRQD